MDLILKQMGWRLFYLLSAGFLCSVAFAGGQAGSLAGSSNISHLVLEDPLPTRSVWKIQNRNGDSGTAFAVGPHRVVTNFHVILAILSRDWNAGSHVFLRREGAPPLAIQRLIAISPHCDLALLETEAPVSEWLQVADSSPSIEDSLSLWSCDKEQPKEILSMGGLRCAGHHCFFPTNRLVFGGSSGSPILSSAGEVAAVVSLSADNLVYTHKKGCLKHFLEGIEGLPCAGLSIPNCMTQSLQTLSSDNAYDLYILSHVMTVQGIFSANTGNMVLAESFYRKAFSFLQLSAQAGFSMAQNDLAVSYRGGEGVLKDDTKAAYWYREAANQDHVSAQFNLADMLYDADGASEIKEEAFLWYQRAARQGLSSAQFQLALMWDQGEGTPQNFSQAFFWHKEAANRGHKIAQATLMDIYYRGVEGVVEQDKEQAFRWGLLAARQGHPIAQYRLGFLYEKGEGTERNFSKAVHWYREAANQDHLDAQLNLIDIYYYGVRDVVEQDKEQAFHWAILAARQGDPIAQFNLGRLYETGEGTEQNLKEAVRWYKESADQGTSVSQYRFALMAEQGRGMDQDIPLAIAYYEKAALQNHEQAQIQWDFLTNKQI